MTDFAEESKQKWSELKAADEAAKAAKTLVGRYLQHSDANGCATYVITAETGRNVEIEWVDIDDGWVLPAWGKSTKISRVSALSFLYQRDLIKTSSTEDTTKIITLYESVCNALILEGGGVNHLELRQRMYNALSQVKSMLRTFK